MKNIKTLVIIIILSVVSGCYYSPWKSESYLAVNAPQRGFPKNSHDLNSYPDYTVDQVVFKVFIKAHNETLTTGESPFYLTISANTQNYTEDVYINKIKVYNGETLLNWSFGDSLPIILKLEPNKRLKDILIGYYKFKSLLDLKFIESRNVYVQLEVQVGSVIKTLKYEFKPILKKSSFMWISA